MRRFRAEASFGIGNWLNHLDTLCIAGVIINCYATYFISSTNVPIFVKSEEDSKTKTSYFSKIEWLKINTGWDKLDFFIFVVVIEHVILVIKLIFQNFKNNLAADLQLNEQHKQALIQNFKENVNEEEECRIWRNKQKIENSKNLKNQFTKKFKDKHMTEIKEIIRKNKNHQRKPATTDIRSQNVQT